MAIGGSPLVVAGEGATESASESALSGLVAGAAVSTAKQLLLYPVDTVKVCIYKPGTSYILPKYYNNTYC